MNVVRDMIAKLGIASELVVFLWKAKMWWMIPIVIVLLFLGIVIAFGSATGVGPFIYTLF